MDYRMTKEEREKFLSGLHVAILSLNQTDRGPLSMPVWYWYEPGGNLWFETEPLSRKGRLLEVGTRVTLCVQDEAPPYAYVTMEGTVIDILEDDLELHQIPLASRYLGEQGGRDYLDSLPPTEWKRYIVSPGHWLSYDGSKSAS